MASNSQPGPSNAEDKKSDTFSSIGTESETFAGIQSMVRHISLNEPEIASLVSFFKFLSLNLIIMCVVCSLEHLRVDKDVQGGTVVHEAFCENTTPKEAGIHH